MLVTCDKVVWLPVGSLPYEVSDTGLVRRSITTKGTRKGKILKGIVSADGYIMYQISDQRVVRPMYGHHLVAAAFIGKRKQGMDVNHINGNKADNRAVNLEYVTRKENIKHAFMVGLSKRGEERTQAKLNNNDVLQIRKLCETKELSQSQIGQMFGVSQSIISDIHRRIRWTHL